MNYFLLRHFNFEPSFKLRWCRTRDLLGLQIQVTAGGMNRWSLEFVILINLEHDTIAVWIIFPVVFMDLFHRLKFHRLNGIFDFTFKIWAQEYFFKDIRYTNLWANVMCKTFCNFKQVYLHVQFTSTWVFWWPYKKWWYIVNIIDVIIYSWCCTWTFVWWAFNEMNNKRWNNIFIKKLYPFLNSIGRHT